MCRPIFKYHPNAYELDIFIHEEGGSVWSVINYAILNIQHIFIVRKNQNIFAHGA